ncbi:uromodulin-like 1 isoform X2 [Tachysurus fulvidraco]|uniref:uromodulin-like 1 isoform X2 n=1 Tax=Tachysurus fulvidraco TaxID=1234273 RepID=UPI001FEEE379|nr:uromodulin-like 1 isoform X2 [Tachysurus fulvidraco]
MLWMFWTVLLLRTFTTGHDTLHEGYTLSLSGYHVCTGIELVPMTTVISYKSVYTQMVPCGGWLPWKMCNVTRYRTVYQTQVVNSEKPVTKCCEGFEQVGSYCALALDRSSEFTAKPGVCPAHPVSGPLCLWDSDCPHWQKCCQTGNQSVCVEPQSPVNMTSWLNVTVTVKTAFSLVDTSSGMLNHTRLLHSVVMGALSSVQVSVYHMHSWSSGWFSTSSCLLLGSSQLLSLTSVSDTLLLLLGNIDEVTAVDVRDVDECATPVLRACHPLAHCSNTLGSYNCTCAAGCVDLQPSRPGTQCRTIPYVTNLWVKNVTSSSFQLLWNFPLHINLTSKLILFHGTHQLGIVETELSDWTWTKLQPGGLYTAHVALCMCGSCGNATELKVKTDAQILRAVVRITNVNFTVDLQNPESTEYKTFVENVRNETLRSPDFWVRNLVHSGKVLVLISHLAPGSVVVTFTLVFLPTEQDNYKIAIYLMESLQNSSQFTCDRNFTEITDVDECALGEMDCSSGAKCENTFGSYTCVCPHGYTDANPERPGRTCQENDMTVSDSSPSPSTTTISTTSTMSSLTEATNITSSIPVTHGTDVTVSSSTADWSDKKTTELTSTSSTSSLTQTTTKTASTSTSNTTIISQTELITVECGPGYMVVSVSRIFLEWKHISESSLYLGAPSCNVTQVNLNHVKLLVEWGTCGTHLQQNNQNSTVQVTLYNTDMRLQVPVICTYINSFIISAGYSTSGYNTINNVVEGSGMYHVTVRLLNGTNPLPQNYTLSPEDEVIIEVGLNSNISHIKVVINKCWAHPSNNAIEPPQSIFHENSCPVLDKYTRVLQNGESSHSQLAVSLFYLVDFDVIYLHCQIQICIETSEATCRPNCNTTSRMARTSRGANVIGMAKASCGPLLKSHQEVTLQDTVWNMRTLSFILLALGVCVLAVAALAVALFCRRRMGNYNFQFKPREENFTYHVFNT